MADLGEARALLRDRFGFSDFLPGQAAALEAALDGEDIFVLAPTGAGKSLIYQLPALIRPGLTLVVSPLIALMRDQARKLADPRISRRRLARRSRARRMAPGLRCSRVAPPAPPLSLARASRRRRYAGDCCARPMCAPLQWTRPIACRNGATISDPIIAGSRPSGESLGAPQIIATTATASPRTRADIVENLFARPPRAVRRLVPAAGDRPFGAAARARSAGPDASAWSRRGAAAPASFIAGRARRRTGSRRP